MPPGSKVKIIGPVTVRCGQIMLEPKHIELLGGEVDDLSVTNDFENILARSLGKPENPNPGVVNSEVRENTATNNQSGVLSTNAHSGQGEENTITNNQNRGLPTNVDRSQARGNTTTNNPNHALLTNVEQRQVNVADSATRNVNVSFIIYIFI